MFQKRRILTAILLIVLYFSSRMAFLTKLPIFTDEAIYIRWGQIALQDAAHRFISLEDGKQPLFIWLMLPLLKLVADPLAAGRLVSVFSGLASLTGLVLLSWKLFGEKIAWVSGILYVISPFFLLYDRLALYDSLTAGITIWSLLLSIILVQTLRLDAALILGMVIGAGLLTKSSAQFSLVLLPVSLVLFRWGKTKKVFHRLAKWLALSGLVIVLSLMIQMIIRLSPLSHMVGLKNITFIVSFAEFRADPFSRLIGNFRGLSEWLTGYLTWPVLLFLAIGLATEIRKFYRRIFLLSAWFLVPFISLCLFGIVLYPRFMLFMALSLIPLAAKGMIDFYRLIGSRIKLGSIAVLPIIVLLLLPARISYDLIFNPLDAAIPKVDRNQLMDDWPSGYGIPEVVSFLRNESKAHQIFVGTEGTFGLTPSALDIYLRGEKNIQIKGYWPVDRSIDELTEIARTGKPTFLLLKDTQVPKPEWPVTTVARYRKGLGEVYSTLLRFQPKS